MKSSMVMSMNEYLGLAVKQVGEEVEGIDGILAAKSNDESIAFLNELKQRISFLANKIDIRIGNLRTVANKSYYQMILQEREMEKEIKDLELKSAIER